MNVRQLKIKKIMQLHCLFLHSIGLISCFKKLFQSLLEEVIEDVHSFMDPSLDKTKYIETNISI